MKNNLYTLLLLVTFLVVPLFPQTQWTEYTGNPIVPLGSPGTWDYGCVFLPRIIKSKDTLKMFYGGTDGPTNSSKPQIGLAWSLDGSSWNKYAGNPVLPKSSGGWDNGGTAPGGIIEDGDTLRMWYYGKSASSATYPSSDSIGYATSVDAINWDRYSNPVLFPGVSGEWDHDIFYPGNVIKEDGVYKMWYSGGTGVFPTLDHTISIGYATSGDGIQWTKYNDTTTTTAPYQYSDPVLMHGPPGSYDARRAWSAHVLKTADGYEMWYTGSASIQAILYATSPDGIHWTKRPEPVLQASSWAAGNALLTPSVLLDNNIYHMWFSGAVTSDHQYLRIGYAVSIVTAVEHMGDKPPFHFELSQNYPNPLNPSTKIKCSIPQSSKVTLKIFDALGREVVTLVNEEMSIGTYEINWNAENLPSGVYFYQLKAGVFTETKKLILMK